jgi:hypothetical protein
MEYNLKDNIVIKTMGNSREVTGNSLITKASSKNQEKSDNVMGLIVTEKENPFPLPIAGSEAGEYLRIGCWNIRGANNQSKLNVFMDECYNHGYDIVAITETKLKNKTAKNYSKSQQNFKCIWSCSDKEHYSNGVGLIIMKQWAKYLHRVQRWEGQMVTADLLFKRGVKLRIIAVYIPSNNAKRKKATEKEVIKELQKQEKHRCQ